MRSFSSSNFMLWGFLLVFWMESNKPFGKFQNRNVNYFLTCNFIFSIRVPAVLLVQYCVFCLCPKLQRFLWWFFRTCLPASTAGILRKCTHIWLQEYCHSWGNIRQLKNKLENSRTNIQAGKKMLKNNESVINLKPFDNFLFSFHLFRISTWRKDFSVLGEILA